MVSIVFDKFRQLLMETQDKRDNRDPTELGNKILNRPKGQSALDAADRLEHDDK